MQPRPEGHAKSGRPAGANIAAQIERFARSFGEHGRGGRRNLITRIQTPEVRDVAMRRFGLLIFLKPFHHATIAADARGRQAVALSFQFGGKNFIRAKNFR